MPTDFQTLGFIMLAFINLRDCYFAEWQIMIMVFLKFFKEVAIMVTIQALVIMQMD